MARPAAKTPLALLFATTAVLSAGCFDTSSTLTTVDYPTRLTFDPLTFRGSLPCGAPGLARYLVTVMDVSSEDNRGARSSGPVACQNHLSFGDSFVTNIHLYTARIYGYDREVIIDSAGEVEDAGRPRTIDPTSGEEILPKWTTTCGEVPPPAPDPDAEADASEDSRPPYNPLRYPTMAYGKVEVIMQGCLPLAATPTPDASTGDGSSGGVDGSPDAESPAEASAETSDATDPDSGEPGDDDSGDDAGTGEDAADEGAADAPERRRSR
ncbi:MAG TPA: hypothetical protein VK540_03140 [Polyangiaceae bacterium]|jgi:hypothetical protein|nr:hypothetical protein [Polyangiaceae bacterium]